MEFLSNTGPDPLNITNLPSQHSMLGHHRHASDMPFKWRFAGPLNILWYPVFGSSLPSSTKKHCQRITIKRLRIPFARNKIVSSLHSYFFHFTVQITVPFFFINYIFYLIAGIHFVIFAKNL